MILRSRSIYTNYDNLVSPAYQQTAPWRLVWLPPLISTMNIILLQNTTKAMDFMDGTAIADLSSKMVTIQVIAI